MLIIIGENHVLYGITWNNFLNKKLAITLIQMTVAAFFCYYRKIWNIVYIKYI